MRSSGTKNVTALAGKWVLLGAIAALAVGHVDELRRLTTSLLAGEPSAPALADPVPAGAPAAPRAGATVEIRAASNGHYHAEIEINGRPLEVLVDTGATMVALSYEDALRAGVYLRPGDFTQAVSTANGITRVAPVVLDRVTIGDITVRNVRAAVCERGRLQTSLLGMSFLGRLSRVDMRPGMLVLQE